MSLRRKVLLVFLMSNLLTLAGFAVYGWWEARRTWSEMDEYADAAQRRLDHAVGLLLEHIRSVISDQVGRVLGRELDEVSLLMAVRGLPVFDEPYFRGLVDRITLIRPRSSGSGAVFFNLRRRYIFGAGELDKQRALEQVRASMDQDRIVFERGRVAGPLVLGERPWGGFYLSLQAPQSSLEAGLGPLRPIPYVLLIGAPGLVFMFWFLYEFVTRSVLHPVEELGRVARAVAGGDYSRRVRIRERHDELGRVVSSFNRMLDLVQDYKLRMEARVREATSEIERKNRELMLGQRLAATGTLASGIAHEINNPLGGMVNALNRLKKDDLPPERRRRYMELVEENVERIGTIVRQVLAVSPRKMVPAPLDLGGEIEKVLDLVGHRARRKGVEVRLDSPRPGPVILGEANEIGQVFLNLLINGVDASHEGGRVDVEVRSEEGWAVVEVRDSGPGMSPEVAARAFDLFFSTKEAGQGTGLGLAIVHNLVQAHGGTITLDSEPGRGTRFEVRLPLYEGEPGEAFG